MSLLEAEFDHNEHLYVSGIPIPDSDELGLILGLESASDDLRGLPLADHMPAFVRPPSPISAHASELGRELPDTDPIIMTQGHMAFAALVSFLELQRYPMDDRTFHQKVELFGSPSFPRTEGVFWRVRSDLKDEGDAALAPSRELMEVADQFGTMVDFLVEQKVRTLTDIGLTKDEAEVCGRGYRTGILAASLLFIYEHESSSYYR